MNAEKLKKLQMSVRIGGKGTARRKKKTLHHHIQVDEKKVQTTLKKLNCNPFPGVDEANMFKDDGTVMHFDAPKVQLALGSNMIAVTGNPQVRPLTEMFTRLVNQLGPEQVAALQQAAQEKVAEMSLRGNVDSDEEDEADEDDEDIPSLVEDFEQASLMEGQASGQE